MSHKNNSDKIREDGEEAFSQASKSTQEEYQDKQTRKMAKANHEKINEVLESGGVKVKKHHGRRNLIIVLCLILVLAIVGVAAGFMFTGSPNNIEDLGFATVRYDVPTDGSKPTDHTGVENIGYMNDRLRSQPYYYAEMHGTVNTIMTQEIWTYKQYYNGILISSDITESSMINSAVQFCTTDDWVIWRNAAGGKSTYDGLNTVYSDGEPTGSCSIADFKVLRGFPPTEFSVYVLNEDTIDDWSEVIDNGDGTYTQTFYLHVESEPYENSAIYYYKQQMVATGGLTDFPTFTSAQITYTFDDTWQVLKAEVSEAYKATMGVSVSCTASSTTEYQYDLVLCENTAYEDYFSKYENVDIASAEDAVTATSCLAQAFGSVLTDPVTFSLDMNIDGQPLTGLLYLDITDMDIRADIGNIQLYIEEPDDDSMWLYLSYGDDTKVKLDINSLDFSSLSSGSGGLSLDTDELLAELSGGEFTVSDDGSVATLNSTIDLLGLSIPVNFVFNIDEAGVITLGDVSTNLSLLGMDLDISVEFSDTEVPALTSAEKDAYMDIDDNAEALINLIATFTSNEQEFSLEYGTDSFDLTVTLSLDLSKSLAKGEIDIWFGSGTHKFIGVDYKDGNLYLTLDSADMQPLKVKANIDEAIDLISSFLSTDTDEYAIATVADDATSSSTDLSAILASLNIDLGDIVYKLLADNDFANTFHITEDGKFEIDATELLAIFDVDLDLGTIYLVADETGVYVDDGPFDFSLTQGESFEIDDTYFVDAEDLVTLVEELETLIEGKSVGLTGAIDVVIGEGEDATTIEVTINNLTVDWNDGVNVYLQLSFDLGENTQNIYVLYTGNTNTLQLAYGSVGMELNFDSGEGSDLDKLESALVAAYNQIAGIANYYLAEGSEWTDDAASLQEILEGFGVAIEATESAEDLIEEILGLFPGTDSGSFSIMGLLGDMSFGLGANNGFEVKIAGLDLEITDVAKDHNDQFTMDINLAYKGDSFEVDLQNWEVSAGQINALPETVQFVTADDIATLIDSLTATAEILTGTTEINVTYETSGMAISAEILFSLENSNASGLITAAIYGEGSVTKYVGFSYEEGMFYLSMYSEGSDPFLVKANVQDAITLISSFFTSGSEDDGEEKEAADTTGAILSAVTSIVTGETFTSIVNKIFGQGEFFNIFTTDKETSTVKIDIDAICKLFNEETDLGTAYFSIGSEGIILDLDNAYGVVLKICGTDDSVDARSGEYTDAEDLLDLINNITPIIEDAAISLTGEIDLNISGTTVYLEIKESRIDWSNGNISVYVKAALGIGETDQDIWISYEGSTKTLQFAYGDVGAELSFASGSTDVATLKDAVIDVYNRVVGVINSFAETGIETVDTWDDLLSLLGTGADLTDLLGSLFSSGESSGISTEDIMAMIASATLGVGDNGGLAIGIGDYLTLEIADITKTNDGKFALVVNLGYSSETVSLTLDSLTLTAADTYEMPNINYLGADDFASMLDFVASGLEILAEKSLTLTISGTQYDYTSDYRSSNYVKYNFTGTLAMDWGSSTYPITTDEDGNVYIASDIYIYLGLEMVALNSADTSYTMSLYILDRNYDGTTDDALDLYLLISQKATTDKNYDPLMIYIPANDVMSLVSMAGALFDLDSLTSDSSIMQSILTAVAGFVDSALIDTYIPDTQDQFRSLGSSLIGQFIDGGLQGLIDSLVDSVNDVVDTVAGGSDIVAAENRTNKDAYIKSISVGDTEFSLVVNSESVYGSSADDDLTFTATKDTDGKFTGMTISNVYYNDMTDMLDMSMAIEHSVTRETSFTGYTNFSGIDTLLQTLVNSATHEVSLTDSELENNGEATAEEYEEAVKKYGLNSNFFISGSLKLSLLSIYNITLTVDGISVNLDENNKLSMDAEISYSPDALHAAINKTATVTLSIRNDMIYMRKTVSGSSEYRIMTLSAFGDDIMDQISWILSFTSLIQSMMSGSDGGSGTDMSDYDFGALVYAYLDKYSYTADSTSASWEFDINGDTIGDLAGISLSDLVVTLNATKDESDTAYVLTSLGISTSMYSVIKITGTLTYDNPQGAGSNADELDTLYDIGIYDDLTWDEILGGTTYDEICENINWDRILSDLGTTYLVYTGSGDLRVGQVDFYFSDGSTSTKIDSEYVLYNASTSAIYTTLVYPDLTSYDDEANELKAVWSSYSFNTTDNIITITATRETTYTVTVMGSEYGNTTSQSTIQHVYESTYLAKDTDTLVLVDGSWYMISYYADAQGNDLGLEIGYDTEGNECYILPVSADTTVYAVWKQAYGVTFYDPEDGTEETLYYYEGTVLTDDNMPAVPVKKGYTVTWNTASDGTGESSYEVAATGNSMFYAVYSINHYDITFASDLAVASADTSYEYGFEYNEETGYYEFTVSLEYGSTVTLENVELDSKLVTVNGWTYNGTSLAAGSLLTAVDDMTFYVDYSYKTITVHYYYDQPSGEETADDLLYMKVTHGSDGDYTLVDVPDLTEFNDEDNDYSGYVIFGWVYSNRGVWAVVSNLSELVEEGETSLDVYLLIAKLPELTLTASRATSGGIFNRTYTYSGTLTATEMEFVGVCAGGTVTIDSTVIEYYVNNDGNVDGTSYEIGEDDSTSEGDHLITSDSYSFSYSSSKSYVVAHYTLSFTLTIGDFEFTSSCTTKIANAV